MQEQTRYKLGLGDKLRRCACVLLALAGPCALFLVFVVAPDEKVMGAIQRVFYFHVSAAVSAYASIFLLGASSIGFLKTKKLSWDLAADSASAVSLLFASIVLGTGIIWGRAAWGVWWRWEPRLTTFALLWLILLAYRVLRDLLDKHPRKAQVSAVVGTLALFHVPVVMLSVRLFERSVQLHPQGVVGSGLHDSRYILALVVSMLAMLVLGGVLFVVSLAERSHRQRLFEMTYILEEVREEYGDGAS